MNFNVVNPKFILLEKRSRTKDFISTDSGFELEMGIHIDQSLINHLARYGTVKQSNPSPDSNNKSCPLQKGDRVFSDFNLYNGAWQDPLDPAVKENPELAQMANKQNIIAYERDSKIYGYPKVVIKEVNVESEMFSLDPRYKGVNNNPKYVRDAPLDHFYREGYHFAIHREDLYNKIFRNGFDKIIGLDLERDSVRDTLSCFEIISEEGKGVIVLYNFDYAIPVDISIRDYNYHNDPDFKTCLTNKTYYGIEISEIICQVEL